MLVDSKSYYSISTTLGVFGRFREHSDFRICFPILRSCAVHTSSSLIHIQKTGGGSYNIIFYLSI